MQEFYGQCRGAAVLLHGGAGTWDHAGPRSVAVATVSLRKIAAEAMRALKNGIDPLDVVVDCLHALELDEAFNAGRGAALQSDGQARLTAALMDGRHERFSGVISATSMIHPSALAKHLQTRDSRVLTSPGTELLARELKIPVESAVTAGRLSEWNDRVGKGGGPGCDTVGALVRTADGRLVAGTSTGGRGFEFPGRVSDSATVAGTYCSKVCAVSATGVGEQIVDTALAARLETRRRDGLSLEAASRKCMKETVERRHSYGWITVDHEGFWGVTFNTPEMAYIVFGPDGEIAAPK